MQHAVCSFQGAAVSALNSHLFCCRWPQRSASLQFCQTSTVCLLLSGGCSQRALNSCLCVAGGRSQRPETARGQVQGQGIDFQQSPGGRNPRRDLGPRGGRGLARGGRGRSVGGFPERRQSGSFSEEAYGDTEDWGAGTSTWGDALQVGWLQLCLAVRLEWAVYAVMWTWADHDADCATHVLSVGCGSGNQRCCACDYLSPASFWACQQLPRASSCSLVES